MIKEAPTSKAIKLLIERVELIQNGKKIDLRVESTLMSIQKMVAGEGLALTTGSDRGPSARKKLLWSFYARSGEAHGKAFGPHRGPIHYRALQVLL